MQIVNLRHRGYDDDHNVLLTLQAPDDPNGGIHHETARLACCILANNRWDGYLSITQENPKPAVTEDGILRRKDYYFHLPDVDSVSDRPLIIDKRDNKHGPHPITARFRDWIFPAGNLPPLWTLAGAAIQAKVDQNDHPVDEDGDPLSEFACRLCGRFEERNWVDLWDTGERDAWDREKSKLAIFPDLSDPDNEDNVAGCGDKLLDNRNFIKLGADCSLEEEHCDLVRAYKDAQFVFTPKFEHTGEPVMSAHKFGIEEDGLATAHDKPLLLPEKSSLELLFAHFAWAAFSQLRPFLRACVTRSVQVIDKDGVTVLLDASPNLCELIEPQGSSFWTSETAASSGRDDDLVQTQSGADCSATEDDELADVTTSTTSEETSDAASDEEVNSACGQDIPQGDATSPVATLEMDETQGDLAVDEANQEHGEDEGSQTGQLESETEVQIRHDAVCDSCDKQIYKVRYKCLDCPDFDYCPDCISKADTEHMGHRFLPIDDSPYLERIATGKLVAKAEQARSDAASSSSSDSEDEALVKERNDKIESFLQEESAYSTRFNYESPLSDRQIRLLTLWPGRDFEQVVAHLEAVSLDTAPSFEALSYCWGDPSMDYAITLSGAKTEVTRNLKVALLYLRHPNTPRTLWVDAICINQGDKQEKERQVNMMRDIYRRSRQTVVWLGEEADESSKAFAMCDRLLTTFGNEHFAKFFNVDVQRIYEETLDRELAETGYQGEELAAFKKGLSEYIADESEGISHPDIEKAVYEAAFNGTKYNGPFKDFFDFEVAEAIANTGTDKPDNVYDPTETSDKGYLELGGNDDETVKAPVSGPHKPEVAEEAGTQAISELGETNIYKRMALRMIRLRGQESTETLKKKPPSTDEITALHAVFRRPWFQRVWIIQEIGVANVATVQCGAASIDWFVLYMAFMIAARQKTLARLGPGFIRNIEYMSATRGSIHDPRSSVERKKLGLQSLLGKYRRYKATDSRDKVYALLGITTDDMNKQGFTPNYSRSVAETYKQLAIVLLRTSDRLDLLSVPRGATALTVELPSWVPDWSDTGLQPYALAGDRVAESQEVAEHPLRIFRASGYSRISSKNAVDNDKLHLKGYTVDRVQELGDVMTVNEDDIDINHYMRSVFSSENTWRDMLDVMKRAFALFTDLPKLVRQWDAIARIEDRRITYPTGEDNATVYQRTLFADVEPNRNTLKEVSIMSSNSASEQFRLWRTKLQKIYDIAQEIPSLDIDEPTEQSMEELMDKLLPVLSRFRDPDFTQGSFFGLSIIHPLCRRLGRTEKGYLCLLPAGTQPGDQLVLLQGGTTPYVTRPAGEDWELVGEAYVHGLMYGEAWDKDLCRNIVFV